MTSKRGQSPHQLVHLIKDALRRASRSLHMRLAEHSVSLGHWTFLRILWVHDGITQSELSERAGLMQPTTFFAVNGMEQLGYITREKLPDSRRNVHIFLTPTGKALRKKLVPYADEIDALAVAGISGRDIAVTRRTLLAMIQNLADDELEGLRKKRRVRSTREISRFVRGTRSKLRRASMAQGAAKNAKQRATRPGRAQRSAR
jgi:DNA-binding MarR family transcriptional regulator